MKKLLNSTLLFIAWIYLALAVFLKPKRYHLATLVALLLLSGTANAWVCRQWRSEGVVGITRVLGVKCERVR
jgi:hypothetical protein